MSDRVKIPEPLRLSPSSQSANNKFMSQLVDQMSDKIAKNIDWRCPDMNPVSKIKIEGGNIKRSHIPLRKLYLNTGMHSRVINTSAIWPLRGEPDEMELTFKDGGFV